MNGSKSFTDNIRQTAQKLSTTKEFFSPIDLSDSLSITDSKGRMRVRNIIKNLTLSGEIIKTGPGHYQWQGKGSDDACGRISQDSANLAHDNNILATLTQRVRDAAESLGRDDRTFTIEELILQASATTPLDKKRINTTVRDLMRAGEIERRSRGVYALLNKKNDTKPQIQEIMWRIFRARRTVSIEDLQELAGASHEYAREWLGMLARQEYARKLPDGRYGLIEDPVEMPRNEGKIEKLRRLREHKKQTLSALDAAFASIAEARMAITQLDILMED